MKWLAINMDKYEAWMKQWNTYKFNWIDSVETVDAFVINAVPPRREYSTMLHFELALEIGRSTGYKTRINQKGRCIEVLDGSTPKPMILFHDDEASSRYPWSVDYGMAVDSMTATYDPVDVTDEFGMVSLRLVGFRRVHVLKVVRILKNRGFGVLHGLVASSSGVTGESSTRFHSKLPSNDDPIWKYV